MPILDISGELLRRRIAEKSDQSVHQNDKKLVLISGIGDAHVGVFTENLYKIHTSSLSTFTWRKFELRNLNVLNYLLQLKNYLKPNVWTLDIELIQLYVDLPHRIPNSQWYRCSTSTVQHVSEDWRRSRGHSCLSRVIEVAVPPI